MIELELRFTGEHMDLFAAGSGDRSALHTDPAFARRTPFGGCIVYGGLLTLGLLGSLPPDALGRVRMVRSWFPGPVLPDTTSSVRAVPHRDRADAWEVQLTGRGKVLARVIALGSRDVTWAEATLERATMPGPGPGRVLRAAPAELAGEALAPGEAIVGEYRPGPELRELALRFGAGELDPTLLEGVGWASYVVGMGIPGFQGLCAAVTLTTASEKEPASGACGQGWISLRNHDERTEQRLVEGVLADSAGAARTVALIECFSIAPPALPDPAALGISGTSAPARGSVVVVGGSRGFGAALTLALLGRGYAVHAVYSVSSDGAAELARLADPQAERLFLHQLDARDATALTLLAQEIREAGAPVVGLALNAAPPPLSMGLTGTSGGELADYVADSLRLAAVPLGSLLPLLDVERGWVLFSSSSAVTAPPRDWPHVVSAKAALEGLARWVAVTVPTARSVVIRPPTMRTDLTNTPSGRIAATPTESVAAWIVERIASDELQPGLSILEPDAAEEPGT